jgi:hypothetical protein
VIFCHRPGPAGIGFIGEPAPGTAVESTCLEVDKRGRGAAATGASELVRVLITRNVLDCSDPDGAWAVPAGIPAALPVPDERSDESGRLAESELLVTPIN